MKPLQNSALRLFVVLTLASLPASAAPERLKFTDLFDLEYATDPQISPDGKAIVYVRNFCDVLTDKRYANLWWIHADGQDQRPLTTGQFNDSSPRWSPDGKQLIFISNRDGKPQVHRVWVDSGQVARITNVPNPPSNPGWSPDGRWISFVSLVSRDAKTIPDMPKAPKDAKWAEPVTLIDSLIYRFDKNGYLKPGNYHVFVVPVEGGTARQVTRGDFDYGNSDLLPGVTAPEWSPDGTSILTIANRHPEHDYEPLESEIYEINLKDGATRQLTDRRGPDTSPKISPDGKWIAYLGFDDELKSFATTRVYLMDRQGGQRRLLAPSFSHSVSAIAWAGNGLLCQYDEEGETKIGSLALDGQFKPLTRHVGSGSGGRPYAGGSFSAARAGAVAFTYTLPDLPGEVALLGPGRSDVKVLTSLNADVLSNRDLGTTEEIRFESSIDQRKIQGWIIKPPGFDSARKYPLILEIHGGPFANYGPRFAANLQLYAAHEYVVLYINPRGSTSYSEEFANLIHHKYPGDDYYDLMSGVDAVIAKGFVDANNLFVTGGSGGGVLTCWVIGKTNRFRAAVSAFPVINWYSFVLTADANNYFYKYWFPGFPWDHAQHYLERSPISLVGNVTTPTLVMTGEEDYRTPISESEQYYQALKLRKVEAVLARVPGEPHGVSQRPSHQIASVVATLNWFESHRKTGDSPPR
jgi:acylaminoacyl-peptidase